jgi:hypothetical protein
MPGGSLDKGREIHPAQRLWMIWRLFALHTVGIYFEK